jgi:hypothetical protein
MSNNIINIPDWGERKERKKGGERKERKYLRKNI